MNEFEKGGGKRKQGMRENERKKGKKERKKVTERETAIEGFMPRKCAIFIAQVKKG